MGFSGSFAGAEDAATDEVDELIVSLVGALGSIVAGGAGLVWAIATVLAKPNNTDRIMW